LELKLRKREDNPFYAYLETITVKDENGNFKEFRITVTDIQNLKNTEEALKESEERYRQIFVNNHAPMLLIDPINGDFVDANPAATNFYGYTLDELIKLKISDINVSDDKSILKEMLKAVSNEKNHFIFKHLLANGEIRDVDVYSGLINQSGRNLLYSIVHDVTAQKKAEIARRNSEELFRLIFAQSPLSSAITKLDYTPLRINDAFGNMLGYSKEELYLMKFTEYTHLDDIGEEIEQLNRITSGEIDSFEMEKKYIHKNGEILYANLFISAVKDQFGKLVRFLVIVEDVTQRKKTENLVKQRTDRLTNINKILNVEIGDYEKAEIKLENLIEKLENSNKELEQFAYVASHDLREPLRMITSFLELLKKKYENDLDGEANEFIDYAVDGAQRMDVMIKDLLDYSRISSQERKFEYLKSEEILNTALLNLNSVIIDSNTNIIHGPLPLIYANDQQMIQLFQNLIGNAIKYRGKENPEIQISYEDVNDEYIFSIKDNGIGIDKKHLKRIFNIFHRLHTSEEYEGTGIGLAISEKILEKHRGKIWAESEKGKGTTFHFTIPNQNY
jgi:PAS domain S-box-containing protein